MCFCLGLGVFVPEEFLQDEQVVYTMLSADWRLLKLVPRKAWSKELLRAGIERSGMALSYAPLEYREDKELVLLAVAKDDRALVAVPAWLRHDRDVMCTALRVNPAA